MGKLVFTNQDARPKIAAVDCSPQSVHLIMAWYGGFHAEDRYKVTYNGRDVPKDDDGECLVSPEVLAGLR